MSAQENDKALEGQASGASVTSADDYSAALVSALNAALANIPVTDGRIVELPVELNQFRAAALANRPRQQFDIEPANFAASLASGARGAEC